jgi:hypothetical protein
MTSFTSAREAKEFLIARIVEEAEREARPLSEVEWRMLYFTETGWAPRHGQGILRCLVGGDPHPQQGRSLPAGDD